MTLYRFPTSAAASALVLVLASSFCVSCSRSELFLSTDEAARDPANGGNPSNGGTGGPGNGGGAPGSSASNGCLLLGGNAEPYYANTWWWNGDTWQKLSPPAAPMGRSVASAAALNGNVIVLGGQVLNRPLGEHLGTSIASDNWLWNGSTWAETTSHLNPLPRMMAAMATANGKVLLFGGRNTTDDATVPPSPTMRLFGDTWEWDGSEWTQRFPSKSPSARYGASAATYNGHVILFGGVVWDDTETIYKADDTWEWDGSDWKELHPASSPRARSDAAAATMENGKVVLFGGDIVVDGDYGLILYTLGDTWEWNGVTWTDRHPSVAPSPRYFSAIGALRGRVVLTGGLGGAGTDKVNYDLSPQRDTWVWDGNAWSEKAGPQPDDDATYGAMACF